jgi:hypothetical protein
MPIPPRYKQIELGLTPYPPKSPQPFHLQPPSVSHILYHDSRDNSVFSYIHSSSNKIHRHGGAKTENQKENEKKKKKIEKINTKASSFRPRTQRERNTKI